MLVIMPLNTLSIQKDLSDVPLVTILTENFGPGDFSTEIKIILNCFHYCLDNLEQKLPVQIYFHRFLLFLHRHPRVYSYAQLEHNPNMI